MTYYVNAKAKTNGNGTKASPFKTINQAAQVARAGDEVLVAPGIYREQVVPKFGGTGDAPDQRITYKSENAEGQQQNASGTNIEKPKKEPEYRNVGEVPQTNSPGKPGAIL